MMPRGRTRAGARVGSGLLLAFVAALSPALAARRGATIGAAPAPAAPVGADLAVLVYDCDPGDRLAARWGRERLQAVTGAPAGSAIVVSAGGGVGAAVAPRDGAAKFALAALAAAGVDVALLAHSDLVALRASGGLPTATDAGEPGRPLPRFLYPVNLRESDPHFGASDPGRGGGYAVVERAGRRVAFIGVAAPSPSLALPGRGVAGMTWDDPVDALAARLEDLPPVDEVVVLTDCALADVVPWRGRLPRVGTFLVAGRGGLDVAAPTPEGIYLAPPGGRSVGVLPLFSETRSARLVALAEPPEDCPAYRALAARFGLTPGPRPAPAEGIDSTLRRAAALEAAPVGSVELLGVRACNRAVELEVRSVGIVDHVGPARAASGRAFLLVDTRWTNLLRPEAVRDQQLPVAYRIPDLRDHLYLLADGHRLLRAVEPVGVAGLLSWEGLTLPGPGSTARGKLLFDVPRDAPPRTLELRFYDFAHGSLVVPLVAPAESLVESPPFTKPHRNEVVELFVQRFVRSPGRPGVASSGGAGAERAGARVGTGEEFVTVELRGRSLTTTEADATAFDSRARRGQKVTVGTVADWREVRRYLQLVADGVIACAPVDDSTRPDEILPEVPRFLPDVANGHVVRFRVPAGARSLELRCEFPNASLPDHRVIRPRALLFPLLGERPTARERRALATFDDGAERVAIEATRIAGSRELAGQRFLWIGVAVSNGAERGTLFQPFRQLFWRGDGQARAIPPDRDASARGPHAAGWWAPVDPLWIPAGERRVFELAFPVEPGVTLGDYLGFEVRGHEGAGVLRIASPGSADEQVGALAGDGGGASDSSDSEGDAQAASVPASPGGAASCRVLAGAEWREWVDRHCAAAPSLTSPQLAAKTIIEPEDAAPSRFLEALTDGPRGAMVSIPAGATVTTALCGEGRARVACIALELRRVSRECTVQFEGAGPDGNFAPLAERQLSRARDPLSVVVEFVPRPLAAVRFRVVGKRPLVVQEWFAFEAGSRERSVLSRGGRNIARLALGGCIYHCSTRSARPQAAAIDGDERRAVTLRGTRGATIPLTVAFAGNLEASIRAVRVILVGPDEVAPDSAQSLPRIRVSALQEDPFGEGRSLGEAVISADRRRAELQLAEPALVRFLRIECTLPEDSLSARIAEIEVEEAADPERGSVLLRDLSWTGRRTQQTASLEDLLPGVDLSAPSAPDGQPGPLRDLTDGAWVAGELAPATDHARYSFEIRPGDIASVEVVMAPTLRGGLRVLGSRGEVVQTIEWRRHRGRIAQPLDLSAGSYELELRRNPTQVMLAFDSSSSMAKTFAITSESIVRFARDLPIGFEVALATSDPDVELSRSFTVVTPFSRDITALTAGADGMFERQQGLSTWYDVVRELLGFLGEHGSSGAERVLVYVADGQGGGDYDALWGELRQSRARVYTVGYGNVGQTRDSTTSWSGARGLANVACLRGGRYFEPHDPEELAAAYREIFADLAGPTRYALRVTATRSVPAPAADTAATPAPATPVPQGVLVTRAPSRASSPVLFIVDASGSMDERVDGSTRLDLARRVVAEFVRSAPAEAAIGLRAYGHRFRTIDRERASRDSELLVPVAAATKTRVLEALGRLRPVGGTPLAFSLEQARADVARLEAPTVVLITDGVESFGGDPVRAAGELASSVAGLRLAVVGFAIGATVDRRGLHAMAEAASGLYLDARDAHALARSVRAAIAPSIPYTLLRRGGGDEMLEPCGTGVFGDRRELPAGTYVLRVETPTRRVDSMVRVPGGGEGVVAPPELTAEEWRAIASSQSGGAEEDGTPAAQFCTRCGARLGAGARFCTRCGTRVQGH